MKILSILKQANWTISVPDIWQLIRLMLFYQKTLGQGHYASHNIRNGGNGLQQFRFEENISRGTEEHLRFHSCIEQTGFYLGGVKEA